MCLYKLPTQILAKSEVWVASDRPHSKQYIMTRWNHFLDTMQQTSEKFYFARLVRYEL